MNTIVKGNIEAVDQLTCCIENLKNIDYSAPHPSLLSSSIGQHLRHVIDYYQALRQAAHTGTADYDVRHRGGAVENSQAEGLKALRDLRLWLTSIGESELKKCCIMKTEMLLSKPVSVEVKTTMARELCFAALHLTHHQAMIAALIRSQGGEVHASVGLAPATASFVRLTEGHGT
ncbi:MAG: hypothetical protein OXC07_08565 [Kistimonas sp.]|nr:hypothetical protein [Kistimonas sp.]